RCNVAGMTSRPPRPDFIRMPEILATPSAAKIGVPITIRMAKQAIIRLKMSMESMSELLVAVVGFHTVRDEQLAQGSQAQQGAAQRDHAVGNPQGETQHGSRAVVTGKRGFYHGNTGPQQHQAKEQDAQLRNAGGQALAAWREAHMERSEEH